MPHGCSESMFAMQQLLRRQLTAQLSCRCSTAEGGCLGQHSMPAPAANSKQTNLQLECANACLLLCPCCPDVCAACACPCCCCCCCADVTCPCPHPLQPVAPLERLCVRFNTDAVATLDELLEPSWDQPLGLEVRGWRMLHAAVLCCLGGGGEQCLQSCCCAGGCCSSAAACEGL
jgi:hypothetical protein